MQAERGAQVGICVDLAEPIEDLVEIKLNQLFFHTSGTACWLPLGSHLQGYLFLPPLRHRSLICWKALRTAMTQPGLDFWKSWRDRKDMGLQLHRGDMCGGCIGKKCHKYQEMTGVTGPLVRTSSVAPGAVTPVLLPYLPDNQHVPAEANSLHIRPQAATVSPGLAGMSC